jgi:hypothetical protein
MGFILLTIVVVAVLTAGLVPRLIKYAHNPAEIERAHWGLVPLRLYLFGWVVAFLILMVAAKFIS